MFLSMFLNARQHKQQGEPRLSNISITKHHDIMDRLWREQTMKWPICRYLSFSIDSNTSDAQDLGRTSMAWDTCSLGWLVMATRGFRD